eukprot:c17079_g1_i1 orf=488-859(-)
MAVFTFVCRLSGGTWTAKQHAGQSNLQDSASSAFELQRKLNNLALLTAGSGPVSSSFSYVTPTSAVYQVVIGGVGGTFFGGGTAGVPSGAGGGDAAPPVKEEKEEEKKEEEESDEDMGFSLFD